MDDGHSTRPSPAEIRRALAECMTLADVDRALGWAPGTARRNQWRAADRDGLPPADASLGGEPLWFRATFEAWRPGGRRGRRARAGVAHLLAGPSDGRAMPPDQRAPAGEVGDELAEHRQPPTEVTADVEVDAEVEVDAGVIEQPGAEPVGPWVPLSTRREDPPPGTRPVATGFQVSVGSTVVVWVKAGWWSARVLARDRGTVLVEFRVDAGPLGTLQQRLDVDRVRMPETP